MTTSFADRLDAAVRERGNPCLVGLDPHPGLVPPEYAVAADEGASREARAGALADFLCAVVELVAGRVPAVKPQSAFFEPFGPAGAAAWERVVRTSREAGLLVIGDVKRSDIASTAAAYARAFLEGEGEEGRAAACDAVTVNPYLGEDSVRPFLEVCARRSKGVYVLVRTSNPGSGMFQLHGEPPLVDRVAEAVRAWGDELLGTCGLSSVGAVVGATHPEELRRLRAAMPRTPFLVPGYGAQGAGAREVAGGFLPEGRGALVNSSRGLLYAWRREDLRGLSWRDATRRALDEMIAELGELVRGRA